MQDPPQNLVLDCRPCRSRQSSFNSSPGQDSLLPLQSLCIVQRLPCRRQRITQPGHHRWEPHPWCSAALPWSSQAQWKRAIAPKKKRIGPNLTLEARGSATMRSQQRTSARNSFFSRRRRVLEPKMPNVCLGRDCRMSVDDATAELKCELSHIYNNILYINAHTLFYILGIRI